MVSGAGVLSNGGGGRTSPRGAKQAPARPGVGGAGEAEVVGDGLLSAARDAVA